MIDYGAIVAQVLVLLQQETSEQCCRGASLKRLGQGSPVEPIPTILDACL